MASHGTQGDPQGRVICANCHANNFAGQAQCWQCRAPLSVPGGGQPVAYRPPVPPPLPQAVPPATGRATAARPSALLLIGIGMMTFVIVLMLNIHPQSVQSAGRPTTPTNDVTTGQTVADDRAVAPTTSRQVSTGDGSTGEASAGDGSAGEASTQDTGSDVPSTPATNSAVPNAATSTPHAAGSDPLEDAARRVISREAPNVGLPPPAATSPDGLVHLRSGGTISAEEWNAARRKLQDNPLLK